MSRGELTALVEALGDERPTEVLRAWVAHDQLFCSLRPESWDEVGSWGILLADVARHVANALAEDKGIETEDSIRRIRELFDAEMDRPTDKPTGHFVS